MPITHAKVATSPPDGSEVSSEDWNAEHVGGAAAAGGVETLGPYLVDFDDDDVNNQGFALPDSALEDGAVVLDTLVEITEAWSDDFTYSLGVAPDDEPSFIEPVNVGDPTPGGATNIMLPVVLDGGGLPRKRTPFRADYALWSAELAQPVTGANLAMEVYSLGDPFSSGQLRVWAFVVRPT